ncbi:MAG: type IV toxin-antitoxin system AbiEi family antitoxin [Candidatus Thiodiazotropha sp.]
MYKHNEGLAETNILNRAIDAVARETGLRLHIDGLDVKQDRHRLDAVVRLEGQNERLAAEVKRWAPQANLGALINQILNLPMKGVLVADYVNPVMAEKLREQGIQFIDTVGNAYIDLPPVYVLVTGRRKPKQEIGPKGDTNRAFDRTGLKAVFAFLCQPELVAAPYREIAETTGVAVGTVGWVINGLKAAGFIFEYGNKRGRELTDYKRLLDRWVVGYPEKLRPKVYIGDFIAEDPYWWRKFDIQKFHGYWGGEIAAAHYTRYLKPVIATLYLPKQEKNKFISKARLRAATEAMNNKDGRVEIYQPFWRDMALPFVDIAKPGLVPPILAYADLIATADPRNIEAAGMIYDEYIARHNQQD